MADLHGVDSMLFCRGSLYKISRSKSIYCIKEMLMTANYYQGELQPAGKTWFGRGGGGLLLTSNGNAQFLGLTPSVAEEIMLGGTKDLF